MTLEPLGACPGHPGVPAQCDDWQARAAELSLGVLVLRAYSN